MTFPLEVFDLSMDVENKFEHLLSVKAVATLHRAGSHGIGIAVRDGEELVPAGTMVFLPDMMQGEENAAPVIELIWLYVDENYRGGGVGKRLMELFAEIVNESGINGIICDVPMDSDCDGLVSFLEDWGFAFNLIEKNEFLIPWDEIKDNHILSKATKTHHVVSLDALPEGALSTALRQLQIREWSALPINDLDQKLSGIYYEGSTPEGVFLIRRNPEEIVEPLRICVRENLETYPKVIKELLFHAITNMPFDVKEDAYIYVMIRSLQGAMIWDGLFPDIKPVLVRRGINILEEESHDKA